MNIGPERYPDQQRYEQAAALTDRFDSALLRLMPDSQVGIDFGIREPISPVVVTARLADDPTYSEIIIMGDGANHSIKEPLVPDDLRYVCLRAKEDEESLHIELNRAGLGFDDPTSMGVTVWIGPSPQLEGDDGLIDLNKIPGKLGRTMVGFWVRGLIEEWTISPSIDANSALKGYASSTGKLRTKWTEGYISRVQTALRRVTEVAETVDPEQVVKHKESRLSDSRFASSVMTLLDEAAPALPGLRQQQAHKLDDVFVFIQRIGDFSARVTYLEKTPVDDMLAENQCEYGQVTLTHLGGGIWIHNTEHVGHTDVMVNHFMEYIEGLEPVSLDSLFYQDLSAGQKAKVFGWLTQIADKSPFSNS